MTRFIHDQFSKDYLEMLLSAYGSPNAGQSMVMDFNPDCE